MMKQIVRSLLAVAVCCALVFATACGDKGPGESPGSTARGRYVETEMETPEGMINAQYLLSDGAVKLHVYDRETSEFMIYRTVDYGSWEPQESGWYANLPEDEYPGYMAYDRQNRLHVLTSRYFYIGDDIQVESNLYRVSEDGAALEPLAIDWHQAPDNEYYVTTEQIELLANGDYLIAQSFDGGIVHYDRDGRFKGVFDTSYNPSFATFGNQLAILDSESGSVRIYDGESRELISQVEFEDHTRYSRIYVGQNEILYIQNEKGLYRLAEGGSVWEKIIEGDMTSMALPNLYFSDLVETAAGDFYLLTGDGMGESTIMRYHYDPEMAALPDQELVIYTLEENPTIRLAAGEYQKLHPNTRISIQVAGAEGVDSGDLLRALNTELLNGKGPDILVLDGMNVESYIDKGVLLDLSELIAEQSARGNLVEKVVRSYERNGQIYALPTKYHLPVMAMEAPVAAQVESLADLVRYAQANPEKGIMGDLRPETLLEAFLPASAPSWITGGVIDTAQLAEFLTAVEAIMSTGAESHWIEEMDFKESNLEQFHYAFDRSHTYVGTMRGLSSATSLSHMLAVRPGVVTYLPGQLAKTFEPIGVVGINVNSAQTESAQEFLQLLLSDKAQKDSGYNGFSVLISAQTAEAESRNEDMLIGTSSPFLVGEDLMGEWASVEFQQQIAQLAQGVENPAVLDEKLKDLIVTQARGYLTGEKSLEQAVADVEEATKLYLAE